MVVYKIIVHKKVLSYTYSDFAEQAALSYFMVVAYD